MCLRELGQIYGSIEAQTSTYDPRGFYRPTWAISTASGALTCCSPKTKTIGAPMISLHAVPDLPKAVQERLYFIRFEDLVEQPTACMSRIYAWLGLSPFEINPGKLAMMGPPESDSHYHMKYPHTQSERVAKPKRHEIPPRIQSQIEMACAWYYQLYYPKMVATSTGLAHPGTQGSKLR